MFREILYTAINWGLFDSSWSLLKTKQTPGSGLEDNINSEIPRKPSISASSALWTASQLSRLIAVNVHQSNTLSLNGCEMSLAGLLTSCSVCTNCFNEQRCIQTNDVHSYAPKQYCRKIWKEHVFCRFSRNFAHIWNVSTDRAIWYASGLL